MRRSHPLPDQLPGEHTGPQASCGADPLYNRLQCFLKTTCGSFKTIYGNEYLRSGLGNVGKPISSQEQPLRQT